MHRLLLNRDVAKQSPVVNDLLQEGAFVKIEGPAIDVHGNLYGVNFAKLGTVGIVTPSGEASIYVELPEGSVGNGIRFDKKGYMYIADYTMHNILRVDPKDKSIKVFAHNDKMNQPNDVAISPTTEIIYASDPKWADSTGNLWMINRKGETFLLEGNIGTTNGIEVSPDGKKVVCKRVFSKKNMGVRY